MMRKRWGPVAAVAACLLAAGCASAAPAGAGHGHHPASGSAAGTAGGGGGSGAGGAPGGGHARKILVIMEENHDTGEVFPSGMPFLWSVARRYGYATAWRGITHPSLPNYLAIFGGSSFNDPQDCDPSPGCTYPGPSLFGQALAHGETARAYEESMPQPCDGSSSGNYDVNHNPWAYFPGERASCRAHDVPAGTPAGGALATAARAGKLPVIGLLTPNLLADGHNGTLAQADRWLRGWLRVLTAGPDWRAGRLAIVITFDEGDVTNDVPLVVAAPWLHGAVVRTPATHYALTRLLGQIAGLPPLRHAAGAAQVAAAFGMG